MRTPEFSDRLLAAGLVAAAAELGEPLTAVAYDNWQRSHEDAASPTLLIRRFGSWREACAHAGVAANATRSTSRRWSEEEMVKSVADYLATAGGVGSYAGYAAWARDTQNAPSGSLIRQRFTWADVKKRASAGHHDG
ncbi:MAG: hypothetical protein L0H31_11485 [Nocardioidaceae bacterium]|nr:hypothetical protein [Nocardioidaceae bacterium]